MDLACVYFKFYLSIKKNNVLILLGSFSWKSEGLYVFETVIGGLSSPDH